MRSWLGTFGLLSLCLAVQAQTRRELSVVWDDLAPLVSGQSVEVTLGPKQWVEGKVLAVQPDGLLMRVDAAKDVRRFPLKKLLVPRGEMTRVHFEKRTKRWRAILTPGLPAAAIFA